MIYKQLSKQTKNPLEIALKLLAELDAKFAKDFCGDFTAFDTHKYTKQIKSISKKMYKRNSHAISFLEPFCKSIQNYFSNSNMAPVDSFYLLDAFNVVLLLLVKQQKESKSIAITQEQFNVIKTTINLCDDGLKWASSPTCSYYTHVSKSLLAHVQCQKQVANKQDQLEQTAQSIEFGSKIAQDIADKNIVGLSLDAIQLAQKFISLIDYMSIDFNLSRHQFIFNCVMLTDTVLDLKASAETKEEAKKLVLKLTEKTIEKSASISHVALAFSVGKVLLNLSSVNEKKDMYENVLKKLLVKIDPETQFVVLRKVLKCTDYEINRDIQKSLKELKQTYNLSKTLTEAIAESQSENRFLTEGSSCWHEQVVDASEKDVQEIEYVCQAIAEDSARDSLTQIDSSDIKLKEKVVFKPDKFNRTPLILALQILNTTIESDTIKLEELIDYFINHSEPSNLMHEDLLGQTCFDYLAQGNHISLLEKVIELCLDKFTDIFEHKDKNGNYLFHQFVQGKISDQTRQSLTVFCETYKQNDALLGPLNTYLSKPNKQQDTLLHLIAKYLFSKETFNEDNTRIDILKDLLERNLQLSLNEDYKYFFNYLKPEEILQLNPPFILDPFQQCAYDCVFDLANITVSTSELPKQLSQEDKQKLKQLILNIVVNAPNQLHQFKALIDPDQYMKIVELSLIHKSFDVVYDVIKEDSQFLLTADQLSSFLTVDQLKKVILKCNNPFVYLKKIITEFAQHDVLKLDNLSGILNDICKHVEPDLIKKELATLLAQAFYESQLELFSTLLSVKLNSAITANPNYILGNDSVLMQVCRDSDRQKATLFIKEILMYSQNDILLSPLDEHGDLEQTTPLSMVFKSYNSDLFDILIKRGYQSLNPSTLQLSCFKRMLLGLSKDTFEIPVKVGMSLTDVARSIIESNLMPKNYLAAVTKQELVTPAFDSKENTKKLIIIKQMLKELETQLDSIQDEKKKQFIKTLLVGVTMFFNKKNSVADMIKNLIKIYKNWQTDLGHENYTVLELKQNAQTKSCCSIC